MSTTIYDGIKKEIAEAIKRGDTASRDFARVVKAELDRKGDGRPLPDTDAVRILKALRATAEENQNPFEIAFLDKYLPQEMSEAEIEAWVRANVNFASLKSPMAAIGIVTRALGPSATGDRFKRVVEKIIHG
jgi:uncharacterized protein YqeY